MNVTERIFGYVETRHPDVWKQIEAITRLHKMSSVKKIFSEHVKFTRDIQIFNNIKSLPLFLLKFCEAMQRNFLSPGDSYGTLVTCRATKIYTQGTLDKRHLKDKNLELNTNYSIGKDLRFEINIYTSLNQIYELSNKRKFTTIFVKNCTVSQLMNLSPKETCYLKEQNSTYMASTLNDDDVYLNLKTFIVIESFLSDDYLKIIQKPYYKNFIFRHIDQRNVVAFTDLKYVYNNCGIVCYFFNLIAVLKLQFFKNLNPDEKPERDILNILKFQIYTGTLLPINRNGLRKNVNRSGLDKLSFEAIKQNYVAESIKNDKHDVKSSIEKMFFGQQFNEGTGYNFCLMPKK